MQCRAAHWTTSSFDYRSSTTEIVNNLGWRTLEQRQADARLCLFYKIVHGLVAVPLPDYIQTSNHFSRYCHSMTFRQFPGASYTLLKITINTPSFHWLLSSGMPFLKLLHAYQTLSPSRSQLVSCNTPSLRSGNSFFFSCF